MAALRICPLHSKVLIAGGHAYCCHCIFAVLVSVCKASGNAATFGVAAINRLLVQVILTGHPCIVFLIWHTTQLNECKSRFDLISEVLR